MRERKRAVLIRMRKSNAGEGVVGLIESLPKTPPSTFPESYRSVCRLRVYISRYASVEWSCRFSKDKHEG